MRMPKFNIGFTIRSKLLLLSGIMLLALVGTNLYLRSHLVAGGDALQTQAEIQNTMRVATSGLRSFGELKYWLTDLEVSWLNESEKNAKIAQAKLEKHLKALRAIAPEKVKNIRSEVKAFVALSMKAVDSYVDNNRVVGNSQVANARRSIEKVDAILVGIVKDLEKKSAATASTTIRNAQTSAKLSIFVLIATGLITILLTLLIVQSIVKPMKKMGVAMNALAEGNKSVDIPALAQRDEIGEMAQAVQVFKENAIQRERLEAEQAKERAEKETRAQVIEQHSKEFDTGVARVLNSVSSSVSQLRSTSENMSVIAEQTSQLSVTVAATSEQATTNVQTVAAATEELSSSIREIGQQVTNSAAIASKAVEETERTNATVQGLAEAAQKIDQVVELINGIASQTNLLALNATIEAARAGDAGKGFAVVASEVKTLANQTAKATEEIGAQIATMQTVTQDAVGAIGGISKTIEEINEIATGISAAVEEQDAATQEIARNVQEAAKGTQEVSSNITEVKVAATKSGDMANSVLEASADLNKQSDDLRTMVEHYLKNVKAA